MNYAEFFAIATKHRPFGFQERLQEALPASMILKAPTGLGKTDSVLIAWLHWCATAPKIAPRRLIWCLPGRALTEQVAKVAEDRIENLVKAQALSQAIPVYRLLGGSADNEAKLSPDAPAVLVGTQDLLLSRALNRGYARSPFRWPVDFGLLNSDCYWVMDEVQLLGDGLATSLQLAAFREKYGVFGATPSCWISATIDPAWMETVDFRGSDVLVIQPDTTDEANPVVASRLRAEKKLLRAPESCRMPAGVADLVTEQHAAGTLTLVIANTVRRAVEIRAALEKRTTADLRLLHSRFRAAERRTHVEAALGEMPAAGRIVVSTQVIEAGIDVDAALMVTDIAPYPSMVQRFGRVNRRGERRGGRIYWVDRPLTEKQIKLAVGEELGVKDLAKVFAPYDTKDVANSQILLSAMTSAAPADLAQIVGTRPPWRHVLRRADLLDLFDTSSDLGGNQIDISRFVRTDDERNLYVLWRYWDLKTGTPPHAEVDEGELCPAPIEDVKKTEGWTWDSVAGKWVPAENYYPGMTLLMHVSAGKYTAEYGWSPESKVPVAPAEAGQGEMDKSDRDELSLCRRVEQTLEEHTEQVVSAMQRLLAEIPGVAEYRESLERAARLHDWGKAHPVMQKTLHDGQDGPYPELLAKSKGAGRHGRKFFRHELASGLAMLASGESDLAAYVAAAHHGRIRVVIRSMPGEREGKLARVRGLQKDDALEACRLGGGAQRSRTELTLEFTKLGLSADGLESWTERVLRLRDDLGPFRLAYLEMLLRAADEAASALAAQEATA